MAADRVVRGLHRHQPLFRDGLGLGLDRYRRRSADRRRAGGLGAERTLAIVLPGGSSLARENMGAAGRPARRRRLLRLLGRQHSARRGPVERRHQLRRGDRLHLRRSDRAAGPRYLSQVYGWKMAGFLFATFYAAMAGAALIVEAIFGAAGLIPREHQARVVEAAMAWNYTTWLNVAFLALAAALVWRFLKTGGPAMLRMMNRPMHAEHEHGGGK